MRKLLVTVTIALALIGAGVWFKAESVVPRTEKNVPIPRGMVTFTFDDGSRGHYTYAFPVMRRHHLRATAYVWTRDIDLDPWNMTWEQVIELHQAGWEIGSHTHTHPYLTKVSDDELLKELTFPKQLIKEKVGVEPQAFAVPFGEADEKVLAAVTEHYRSNVLGDGGANVLDRIEPYRIKRLTVLHTHTVADICDAIRATAKDGSWLVLAFHQIVRPEEVSEYRISDTMFGEIASCAARLVAQSEVTVVTVSDGMTIAAKP